MAQSTLDRRLGPLDAAAIIVANVIGGGILFTPPQVAAAAPNAFWFLGAWLAGGALAFAGAMAYAELAALRPRAGGEYVYLREAFGRLAAFLTGWTSFVAGFTGAIAASAIVLTFYLERFIPGAANSTPFFVVPLPYVPLTFSRQTLVAHFGDRVDGVGSPARRRARPHHGQRARRAESVGAADVHRARVFDRQRIEREPRRVGRSHGLERVAAGPDPGDVHLLRLERRGLHRRRDSRSGTQRAARVRAGHRRRHRDLSRR